MNKRIRPETIITDLVSEIREKYGINIQTEIINVDSSLIMKARNKDTILINKKYLNAIKEPDILKALLYHELGHIVNYQKWLRYKLFVYIGVAVSGIGLFVVTLFLQYLYLVLTGFLLIIAGLMIIRFFMQRNEYIADLFAAKELGLRYYIEQLKRFMSIDKRAHCASKAYHILAKLFGYPSINSRIERLSRIAEQVF